MQSIIENYRATQENEKGKYHALRLQLRRCETELSRLENARQACEEQREMLNRRLGQLPHTDWEEGLVYPLADALEEATGLHASIYGEYGITRTTIYLVSDEHADFCKDPHLRITLQPWPTNGRGGISYKVRDENAEFVPLPDTIEEIIPLLRGNLEIKPRN